MSEDRRTKGKLRRQYQTATEILEFLKIEHSYSEEELMDGEFEELLYDNEDILKELGIDGYVIINNTIYKMFDFERDAEIYTTEVSLDGNLISFDTIYYNGGGHWIEMIEKELQEIEDKRS